LEYCDVKSAIFSNNKRIKEIIDLKIADFGISSFLTSTLTNFEAGTPAYQATEIWNHKGSDFKSDIW
jgi:serine/threonine protein kinase